MSRSTEYWSNVQVTILLSISVTEKPKSGIMAACLIYAVIHELGIIHELGSDFVQKYISVTVILVGQEKQLWFHCLLPTIKGLDYACSPVLIKS